MVLESSSLFVSSTIFLKHFACGRSTSIFILGGKCKFPLSLFVSVVEEEVRGGNCEEGG